MASKSGEEGQMMMPRLSEFSPETVNNAIASLFSGIYQSRVQKILICIDAVHHLLSPRMKQFLVISYLEMHEPDTP